MKILQNKKYKFAILVGAAGVVLLIMVSILVSTINNLFNDGAQNVPAQKELSFELKKPTSKTGSTPAASDGEELQSKVKTYKAAEQSDERPVNKNISFSSVFKNKKQDGGTAQSTKQGAISNTTNDELKAFLAQEINQTKQSDITPRVINDASSSKSKRSTQVIENEIRSMYTTNPNSTSVKTENKTLTPEEQMMERKKQFEQGFDNNTGHSQSSPASELASEIMGLIHGSQEVSNGGLIAIRLNEDLTLPDGSRVPRNTICFGKVSFSQTRANIEIRSVKTREGIYPTHLIAFSSDGIQGLPVNIGSGQKIVGDKALETVGRTADQVVQSTAIGSMVGSVFGDLTRNSKREKNVTVSFIDNQRVFLRSVKQ